MKHLSKEVKEALEQFEKDGKDFYIDIKTSCEILGVSRYKFNKLRESGAIKNGGDSSCGFSNSTTGGDGDGWICGLGNNFFLISKIKSFKDGILN